MQFPNKNIRVKKGSKVQDTGSITDLTYNEQAGARKSVRVGPALAPINDGTGGLTTDASSIRSLKLGSNLAIYNDSGSVGSVRFSNDLLAAALLPGAVDAPTGDVGIVCKPNDWTYLSNYDKRYIVADSSNLIIYLEIDDTKIINEEITKA
jgi:hypothetical protein